MNFLAKRTGWRFKRHRWEGRQTTGALEDSLRHWCYGGQSPSYQRFTKLSVIHESQCINVCQHTLLLLPAWLLSWCSWTVERTFYFLLFKEKTLHWVKKWIVFLNIQIFCYKKWTTYFLHWPSIVILYILFKQSASSDISLMLWCHSVSQYYLDQWWNKWIWSLCAKYLSHHT